MRLMSQQTSNIDAAKLLLEYYGYDSLSYFSLNKKKKFFFSSTGRSFLSYAIYSKVAVVSANPIGPKDDVLNLIKEFRTFVKGANLTSCFIGVDQSLVDQIAPLGYKKINIGEEAVLPIPTFQKNQLKKRVRRAERHVNSLGIDCRIYSRREIPTTYLNQLEKVNDEWLELKGQHHRGFSMTLGRIPEVYDDDCEFVLALKGDQVIGFLTLVPAYASKCYSLDTMRRIRRSPNGLTEFLMLQAFEHYKSKN